VYTTTFFPLAPAGGARRRCRQRIHAALTARLHGKYELLVSSRKQSLFARLEGDVLEIGPRTRANLAYLPLGARWVGFEPNPFMHPYLQETASKLGLRINIREGCAEQLPVEDSSVEAVIGTLVLCSVDNPVAALREILRVNEHHLERSLEALFVL
jgi:SAM-dependent methyltransferase